MPFFSRTVKKLWVITALLAVINCLIIFLYDMPERRFLRCVSVAVLLLFYIIYQRQRHKWFVLFCTLFFIKDIGMIFYDHYWGNSFYFLVGAAGYGVFVNEILKNKYFKLDQKLVIGSLGLLISGALIVYLLINNLSSGFVATLNVPLFLAYGILSVIAVLSSFQYNNIYNSRRSFWFVCIAISLTASDLFRYIAFYLSLDILAYVERLLYLIGWALLIYIYLHPTLKEEEKQAMALFEEANTKKKATD